MRALPSEVARLRGLTAVERLALRYVGEGLSPREISDRVEAGPADVAEFERLYGSSLPPDDEG